MQSFPGRPRHHAPLDVRTNQKRLPIRRTKLTKRDERKLREILEAREALMATLVDRPFFNIW